MREVTWGSMSGGGPGGPNTAENVSGGRNSKFLGGGQNKNFLEDVLEGLEDGIRPKIRRRWRTK